MTKTTARPTVEINGYALRQVRQLMDLTPGAVAARIDKDRTYIVKMEHGAVTRVSRGVFDALVLALGVDCRVLLANPHATDVEVAA